jgi:pimeloyl-ACP methyl ester carboxylesterase
VLKSLIILPGLDGIGARIMPFVERVAPAVEARVIRYPPDRELGSAELEALVRCELAGTDRYALLAESFSGPIAIRIAADPPPGLVSVILCGTFASNPYPWAAPARALAAWLPLKALPRWLRAPLMWGSADPRRAPARAQRSLSAVAGRVIRRRLRAILSAEETTRLARISLPCLILTARRDRILPRRATRVLLAGLPAAQVQEIDGPHLLLQACPEEAAVAVLRFLARWN